jgi:8-oxo-dGTP pyrophosphatase MutT (NUDIX family)
LDANESPADAIKREVKEETGIGLNDLRLFRVLVRGNHVEVIFSARPIGEPQVLSSEIYELGWFDIDRLPDGTTLAQKLLIGEVLAAQFDKPPIDN